MKLPLIGLQTNPSGTASSPSSHPPSPPAHLGTGLPFQPWATSVDNLVSEGLITSVYTP